MRLVVTISFPAQTIATVLFVATGSQLLRTETQLRFGRSAVVQTVRICRSVQFARKSEQDELRRSSHARGLILPQAGLSALLNTAWRLELLQRPTRPRYTPRPEPQPLSQDSPNVVGP